jgi:UDP-glucose 4-epimerase
LGAKYLIDNNKSILINLGSNNGFSVLEVINAVQKIKSVNYEMVGRREGDSAMIIASNKKAKEILGWIPKYSLDDIIQTDMNFRIQNETKR